MKPSIGRKVYCVYEESILAEPVYAVGKYSFLLDPFDKIEDSYEWYYEDYGKTWFTNLKEAKNQLLENNKDLCDGSKVKVVKINEQYYELQELVKHEYDFMTLDGQKLKCNKKEWLKNERLQP